MPTILANDLEIGYEQLGAGPPLILLHGASSSGRIDFAAQIPSLASAFRLLLPDARGHGATRWDPALGFRAEWLVGDLETFVDALSLATFHLVGFSMGALTALGFASRQPERLRTLVVAAITVEREPRASVARRLLDPERIERDDPGWAAQVARRQGRVQGRDSWRRLLPAIAADVAVQPLLGPRELRTITAPTLVVCGDRDPMAPVDQVSSLARHVRDGRLLVVPDCGHEVLSERPALVNEAMGSFYRSTEAVARERAARQPEVSR
ncbi:MAG: alpha/beta hydrolase [Chloroflexota bacterium]